MISVSENVPRIETRIFAGTTISPSSIHQWHGDTRLKILRKFSEIDLPQPYLLPVRITESHIQLMLTKVLRCCEMNSFGPISYVEIYRPYFYYLSEQASADLQTLIHKQPQPALKVRRFTLFESLWDISTKYLVEFSLCAIGIRCQSERAHIATKISNRISS